MPMYEYHCSKCGQTFEKLQKFSDEPLTLHEGCGGAVEKLLSAPAFQFKGTGWYVTDYAKGSQAGPAAKPKDGAESKPASTETKTETKSEKPAPAVASSTSPASSTDK